MLNMMIQKTLRKQSNTWTALRSMVKKSLHRWFSLSGHVRSDLIAVPVPLVDDRLLPGDALRLAFVVATLDRPTVDRVHHRRLDAAVRPQNRNHVRHPAGADIAAQAPVLLDKLCLLSPSS